MSGWEVTNVSFYCRGMDGDACSSSEVFLLRRERVYPIDCGPHVYFNIGILAHKIQISRLVQMLGSDQSYRDVAGFSSGW